MMIKQDGDKHKENKKQRNKKQDLVSTCTNKGFCSIRTRVGSPSQYNTAQYNTFNTIQKHPIER